MFKRFSISTTTRGATFNYVYGADAPTIRASNTGTQFYHQNGIGNAVAVTNQSGATDGTATGYFGRDSTTISSLLSRYEKKLQQQLELLDVEKVAHFV